MNKELLLSFEVADSHIQYCARTGAFTWKSSVGGVVVGQPAGYINSNGYMVIGFAGQKFRLHRLAWMLTHGSWPIGVIDHVNGDRTDNRLANLREVSQAVNLQNMRVPTKANTSGFLGVYWSGKRKGFMAAVHLGKKGKRRGPYKTAERAYVAYVDLKRKHHVGCTL